MAWKDFLQPGATVASGAISAIANYFTNRNTNETNIALQESANAVNRQLAQEQNQWNLDMWNRQNAYNDPSAQMSRLRAAGINPALAYSNGNMMNEAAPAQSAAGSRDAAAQVNGYYLDPLMMAQVAKLTAEKANIDADTKKKDAETAYQNYMNDIENKLANFPMGSVTVTSEDGSEDTQIQYGNVRVKLASRELESLGIKNNSDKAALNDLLFDIAVKCGVSYYALSDFNTVDPTGLPRYQEASDAMRGSRQVQEAAGRIQNAIAAAQEAQSAGDAAFNKWYEEHKDSEWVQFAFGIVGFMRALGITLPGVSFQHKFGEYNQNSFGIK